MLELIDAHCHLDFPIFDQDRSEVLQRARQAGVGHCVIAATTRSRWDGLLALGNAQGLSVCLGLHPVFLEEHCLEGGDNDLLALARYLDCHAAIVALGECGIDARFPETLESQWQLFVAQLKLARERDLPVVIHCVRANDDVAKQLKDLAMPRGGLIHAFTGSYEQAKRFIDLGFRVGLGGAVTYSRAARLRRAVARLPDDGFVLESDSPDMPLCGYQGQRNEPARVAEVCRVVAELRGQGQESVAKTSSATARHLFGI
ncbi:TatD family hydrolase [Halomonas binhaiensis]|uniref:TatD family hydrolase n=1 Tax=Halomonas binhaiensis TaxID=2562282 RepID=A0A5C1NHH2_9GAMM|nr:TatD family hydrolase [Halomonas binhaiensis]QEM81878.1 TatD family hydrolase [Halomonas binhaiensis]